MDTTAPGRADRPASGRSARPTRPRRRHRCRQAGPRHPRQRARWARLFGPPARKRGPSWRGCACLGSRPARCSRRTPPSRPPSVRTGRRRWWPHRQPGPSAGVLAIRSSSDRQLRCTGSEAAPNEQLAFLEAMKMQHVLVAPDALRTVRTLVAPGQVVGTGDPLLVFVRTGAGLGRDSASAAVDLDRTRADLDEVLQRHLFTLDEGQGHGSGQAAPAGPLHRPGEHRRAGRRRQLRRVTVRWPSSAATSTTVPANCARSASSPECSSTVATRVSCSCTSAAAASSGNLASRKSVVTTPE